MTDDLSNQTLFGFKRSVKLKRIALDLCARIQAQLKIVHVDDPNAYHYQEKIYKNYLEHVKLNRKLRKESATTGQEIQVEYQLEEGPLLATLTKILNAVPVPVGIIAGTSNRYGLGRLRAGARIKGLVACTPHPVFVFGLRCIRHFHLSKSELFGITVVCDTGYLTEVQVDTLKNLIKTFGAQLKIIIFPRRASIFRRSFEALGFFAVRGKKIPLSEFKIHFPDAEIESPKKVVSVRRSILKEIHRQRPVVIAVPEHFRISPFYIAQRVTIPVVPLRDL